MFSVISLFLFCYVIIRQAHNHFLLSKDVSFPSFVTLLCFQFRQQNFSNRNCVLHSQIAVCAFTYIKFSGRFKLFIRKPYLQPDRIIWQKVKYCTQIGIAVCKFCSEGFANLPNAIRCFSIQKSLKLLFRVMVKLRPSVVLPKRKGEHRWRKNGKKGRATSANAKTVAGKGAGKGATRRA